MDIKPAAITSPLLATLSSSHAPQTGTDNFSVTTPIDEFLPQTRNRATNEKQFKNLKDYIAYLLLLLQKMDKVKPPEGQQFVRLEDKPIFQKLEQELSDLTITRAKIAQS